MLANTGLRLLAGAVLVAAYHWGAVDAAACSCTEHSPYKAFDQAYAVFVGRVVGSRDQTVELGDGRKLSSHTTRSFTFTVHELFKGPDVAEIEISAGLVEGSCFREYTTGVEYLVYASGS